MAEYVHSQRLAAEPAGHLADRDPGRGLPGAGALQHRPGLVVAELLHADQVRVSRSGARERSAARHTLELFSGDRVG